MATTFLLCMPLLGVAGVLYLTPRPLALHQVVRADVSYRPQFFGLPEGPLFHTYTLTDASSLAQLERMLNALPALSGTPPCEHILPISTGGSTWDTASISLRTRSGQSFGFDLHGWCGVVMTGPSYYADARNGVLAFLRAHITPPCGNLECPATGLPFETLDGKPCEAGGTFIDCAKV